MKRALFGLLAGLMLAHGAEASEFGRPDLPPGYFPGAGPSVIDRMPEAVSDAPVSAVGFFDPAHPYARAVARLDGQPVRRSLFPSQVSDPVDRALILRDYQRNHFHLTDVELDAAFQRFQREQFHGIAALRDLRLQKEGATLDDYRRYVAEEVKIHVMLYNRCHWTGSWTAQVAERRTYLAELHRKAIVEKFSS